MSVGLCWRCAFEVTGKRTTGCVCVSCRARVGPSPAPGRPARSAARPFAGAYTHSLRRLSLVKQRLRRRERFNLFVGMSTGFSYPSERGVAFQPLAPHASSLLAKVKLPPTLPSKKLPYTTGRTGGSSPPLSAPASFASLAAVGIGSIRASKLGSKKKGILRGWREQRAQPRTTPARDAQGRKGSTYETR
jgi:hypothetical protein